MGKGLQPLLSAKFDDPKNPDWSKLRFPMLASPKLDGIRLRIDPELGGVSRTHKPIPNQHIQGIIAANSWLKYLDGELIVGDPTAPDVFNKTQSAAMTRDGRPDFNYYVFDHWYNPDEAFETRYSRVSAIVGTVNTLNQYFPGQIHLVPHDSVRSIEDILALELKYLELGYEGLMLRDINGRYKNGRSTLKENILIKLKRTEDGEATVIGYQALERNDNVLERDAFGHAKRSSHKANRRTDSLLGALICQHPTFGEFNIGSGFDVSTREEIWQNQAKYLNRQVTFTYQKVGLKEKPRFPIFKGFRND